MIICGALRILLPFVQFSKREKHPWRSVTFSKVAGCTKSRKALNIVYCNSHLVSFCLIKEENKTQKS